MSIANCPVLILIYLTLCLKENKAVELKLVTPVLPPSLFLTVDVGVLLTFSCTGRGPPGTELIISTDNSMVTVLSCEPQNIDVNNVAYCSMRVDSCGISFDVNCQAGDDSITKQTIYMSSSSCSKWIKLPDPPSLGNTVSTPYNVWPFASSGVFIAAVISSICFACRLRRARRQAAINARRATITTTTTPEPLPHVIVSCTEASMAPPYAAAVSDQGSLPPPYSVNAMNPGKCKQPTEASLLDQPPKYETLLNQQATAK